MKYGSDAVALRDQASKELAQMNQINVAPVPAELLKAGKPIYIFNVAPFRWVQELGSMGTWTIHACEDGQRYSKPTLVPFIITEGIPVDIRKIEQRLWSGSEVAKDILGMGPYKDRSSDLTRKGVFVAAGEKPTEQELEKANEALMQWRISLVREGDELFAQGPMEIRNITKQMREACTALNLEREWSKMPKPMINCPGCGELINPGLAVHGGKHGCGAILDKAKAASLGLLPQKGQQ